MYESKTFEVLHQQMLDETPSNIDKREGSITHDMTAPAAARASELYVELDNILKLGFADTAAQADNSVIDYLNKRTSEQDVNRKPEVKATGQLTFTGNPGQVIKVGQRASTNSSSPIYFVVLTEGTIPIGGTIALNAECETGGVIGNVGASTITNVAGNLVGVVAVTNLASFSGGIDRESNEDLLERYYEKVRRPATSGNGNHYLFWAKEVPGVGDAKVFPVWNGGNTVKVVIIDSLKTGADAALVTAATDHIQAEMAIGPILTLISAVELPINISATIVLVSGKTLANAQAEIIAGVTALLKSIAFKESVVRYNQLASLLLDCPSISDYSNFQVNGGVTNITIADEKVAVMGTVTLT
jgi:uncharacterized phage protein gp47/JayE